MTPTVFAKLVRRLAASPQECEWVEFKRNFVKPEEIGEYLSALANSAALNGKECGYIIWGVEDGTRQQVGTTFHPRQKKVGNEDLEPWLSRELHPRVDFRIHESSIDGREFVVFEVPAASHTPVRFKDFEYIRVGSYTKKLRDHPEKERALWATFSRSDFEKGIAAADVSSDEVLGLIDYPNCFRLLKQPLPDNRSAILARLTAERVVAVHEDGEDRFDITNVGAVLFARNLSAFARASRKALRVIIYRGDNRVETIKEQPGGKGYAVGFEGAMRFINDHLPQNELIGEALRREVRQFPELAVRELVANALIHQDFTVSGAGPMVEIFAHRLEITNPGKPLIDPFRFIDEPPRSRNEDLAALMRRMAICEERGSGIDKVISQVELFQLPPPDFRATEASTLAVLFGPRLFAEMDRDERVRACYQHACLMSVSGKRLTNATLRKRLGIADESYSIASRVIRDTLDIGWIKPHRRGSESKKDASYVPIWA
jgi:predicted HTH transcriptional regulator